MLRNTEHYHSSPSQDEKAIAPTNKKLIMSRRQTMIGTLTWRAEKMSTNKKYPKFKGPFK